MDLSDPAFKGGPRGIWWSVDQAPDRKSNMTADETPSFNGTKRETGDVISKILHCFLTAETKKKGAFLLSR